MHASTTNASRICRYGGRMKMLPLNHATKADDRWAVRHFSALSAYVPSPLDITLSRDLANDPLECSRSRARSSALGGFWAPTWRMSRRQMSDQGNLGTLRRRTRSAICGMRDDASWRGKVSAGGRVRRAERHLRLALGFSLRTNEMFHLRRSRGAASRPAARHTVQYCTLPQTAD